MLDNERGGEFDGTIEGAVTDTLEAYEEAAQTFIPSADARSLPGATELVQRLHDRDDTQLALLTGNVQEMAYLKLTQINLGVYFPFGAFACNAEERNHLPQFAVDSVANRSGRTFSGKDVVVIGDTPRDIESGKLFGATSVGVATGHFTVDELAAHNRMQCWRRWWNFGFPRRVRTRHAVSLRVHICVVDSTHRFPTNRRTSVEFVQPDPHNPGRA